MAYTYDDFTRAATAAGMLNQFDEEDLVTAQKYPEYGLSMLSLKNDMGKASTDEQRLLINAAADQLKNSYKTRDVGATDSGYVSPYKDKLDELTSKAEGQSSFSYDAENDPVYSAYRKQYLREAERARADTMAQAAAMSGGRPSSYAVSAAEQAGDYYNAQLGDVIPRLYEDAYGRHLNEYQQLLNQIGELRDQDESAYGRYMDEKEQKQIEFENALRLYQLMGYDAPSDALATLGIRVPEANGGAGISGDHDYEVYIGGEPVTVQEYLNYLKGYDDNQTGKLVEDGPKAKGEIEPINTYGYKEVRDLAMMAKENGYTTSEIGKLVAEAVNNEAYTDKSANDDYKTIMNVLKGGAR